MPAQVRRHRLERPEEARERVGVRAHQRVARVGEVVRHGPVVGVQGRLDGVPDVVAEPGDGIRVRVAVGDRVPVEDPHEASVVGHHDVGVVVELEERRDLAHPLLDAPVDHDPTVRGQVVREEDLRLAEPDRERHLAEPRGDGHPALPAVGRVHVLVAGGVVELLRARADEDVGVRDLAVVDLGPRDRPEAGRRVRRDVLDEEFGEPLGADPVHRPDDHAVAVRVGEVLVDPDPARQVRVRQLPGRQHELAVLPVDQVPVVVDVDELVVGPDLLQLAVGAE